MIKLAFCTSISSSLKFLTLIVYQHPAGTYKYIEADTLLNSSTAAGVEIMVAGPIASPFTEIAKVIGATVPPVGIATLALKNAWKRARH